MRLIFRAASVAVALALLISVEAVMAENVDLEHGFIDHGVTTPISNHRGTVATVDGNGDPVVLAWLMDHRGGYSLLMINALTGEAEQFTPPQVGDSPFASVLSSDNRYYTHYGDTFMEFDPEKREFTFSAETEPRVAMSMTEADDGTIWAGIYPNSSVVSYDPATGEFREYESLYDQNWRQYPRAIAVDDQGWVYFGIGNTKSQMIILEPDSGEATPVLAEDERIAGATCPLWRYEDGKVYGKNGDQWYELYAGEAAKIDAEPQVARTRIIEGSQSLFHRGFPTGHTLKALNLTDRELVVETPDGEMLRHDFDYQSEGAKIMGLTAASDGTICGGTMFPMRFFSYDPETDELTNRDAYHQFNTVASAEELFYMGGYPHGFLLEWDPREEWADTEKGNPDSNPRFLTEAEPDVYRPHDLVVHPDGRHVIMAGTPAYGYTGGGLLFWDRKAEEEEILTHEQILPELSTYSLLPLPDGKLVGGASIAAGTGGEITADHAELYIMDMETKQIEWHAPGLEGVSTYIDLVAGPDGKVFGFADWHRFFVFDPETREIVHYEDLEAEFGETAAQQGPRVFVTSPDGRYFILFARGIAELDPRTYEIEMLAESPVKINFGGEYLDGRIYFGHASHLYSWPVPDAQ